MKYGGKSRADFVAQRSFAGDAECLILTNE
jgi:hypothetical protein